MVVDIDGTAVEIRLTEFETLCLIGKLQSNLSGIQANPTLVQGRSMGAIVEIINVPDVDKNVGYINITTVPN